MKTKLNIGDYVKIGGIIYKIKQIYTYDYKLEILNPKEHPWLNSHLFYEPLIPKYWIEEKVSKEEVICHLI